MLTAWLGIVAFAFQIYYDFSGYSDMAIGLGKMFGFDFLRTSLSLHRPLGGGILAALAHFPFRFRDYLYIPWAIGRRQRCVIS